VLICGFTFTVALHQLPHMPGDWLERLVPFIVTMCIAIAGSRRIAAKHE